MRRVAVVLLLAGCRQVLGIPGEGQLDDNVPRYDVTVVARGVVGASTTVGIELVRSDRSSEQVELTSDGPRTFEVADGLGYTITGPSICTIEDASGTITGGPPAEVSLACDGLAALADAGFSAPVALPFASSGRTFTVQGSFLVQETSLAPAPSNIGGSLAVAVGGTIQKGTNGTWGPIPFVAGTSIEVTSSSPPSFVRPYTFTLADAVPAPFGYGKPATPLTGSRFGSAVAADQQLLVVGAPGPADESAPGHAYVFRRTGTAWVEVAVLQAASPANGDHFGASVAVRDQRIVIGAPRSGTTAGSAYVFVPDGAGSWTGAEVTAPSGDRFGLGAAVAVEVDHILVGAPQTSSAAGAVYQYELDGTAPQTFGAGVDAGDQFGASIAARNGTVVIGAPGESSSNGSPGDNAYPGAGAAYVYTGGLGSTPAYVKANAPAAGDTFGAAVATNGDIVVVGAPSEDSSSPYSTGIDPAGTVIGGAPQSGAVYMWRRDASVWTFAHTLKAPNTGTGDGFGSSLSFVRDVLAIGAPLEDSASSDLATANEARHDAGAVYAYRVILDDITEMPAYVKAAIPGVDDAFGSAVELTFESLAVGAPYDNSAATGWNGAGGDSNADTGAITTYR
jgi:hypothetical protein